MYEVVLYTPKEVFMTYITVVASCMITFPVVMMLVRGIEKSRGLSKWK